MAAYFKIFGWFQCVFASWNKKTNTLEKKISP